MGSIQWYNHALDRFYVKLQGVKFENISTFNLKAFKEDNLEAYIDPEKMERERPNMNKVNMLF